MLAKEMEGRNKKYKAKKTRYFIHDNNIKNNLQISQQWLFSYSGPDPMGWSRISLPQRDWECSLSDCNGSTIFYSKNQNTFFNNCFIN